MELWDVIVEGAKAIVALGLVVGTIHVLASVYAAIDGAASAAASPAAAPSKDELPS